MKQHIRNPATGRAMCGKPMSTAAPALPYRLYSSKCCSSCHSVWRNQVVRDTRRAEVERRKAGETYTLPVRFTRTGQYGCGPDYEDDVYTVAEFKELVSQHAFDDGDGFGHPVRDSFANRGCVIKPSRLHGIPKDATHIVWYNK